ncbi:trehalose 6-phosphate phosphatase [Tistrella bauzanensis]|uniref:Trehalose 6-phosphate phosphatase n=1 Tax=Tistrella bauzanensis TaxID=657419 RepID=A0ABQ1I8Y7_9PROT|nr:trehalose-phosphatase [Tistrella bauzanensis]GGB27364.1 trehalose 6-phosphate phosphatase [Tistrella bauzanensis]
MSGGEQPAAGAGSGTDAGTGPAGLLPEPMPDWALFLDVDGCLIDIAPTPDAVVVTPGLPELLQRLHGRFDGAVALVSGRTLGELDRLFHPAVLPAAGQHGLERRDHPPVSLARGFIEVGQVLERFVADTPGTLIERKSCGYAVHYRARPSAGPAVDRVARALATVTDPPLTVVPGKMVVEVRMPGADKGTAIRGFMQDAPFRGRIPVFIGDDVTDEDGFAMVNAFGGHSIRVGPPPPPATPGAPATAARWMVPDAGLFRDWLHGLAL